MSMFNEIIHKSKLAKPRELRTFGLILGLILLLVFGLFFPWLRSKAPSVLFCALGVTSIVTGRVMPTLLRPVFLVFSLVGSILGAVNNRILLLVIYFLFVVPYSLCIRLFTSKLGKHFGYDKNAESYRVVITDPRGPDHMERTF